MSDLRTNDIARSKEPLVQYFERTVLIHGLVDHEYHATVFCPLVPVLSRVGRACNDVAC